MSRKSYSVSVEWDLELLEGIYRSWTVMLIYTHRTELRQTLMQVSLWTLSLLDKFGIKLISYISKELLQAHILLNVACQYHEEDCNPVLDIVIWLRPHTEMIHTKQSNCGGVNGERTPSTSHPVFLNNPGIVQTQEEMGNLPWSVALQEIKMNSLLPMEENLWFNPIRTTTKCYYNWVLRNFPIQITLIFQLVADHSETW